MRLAILTMQGFCDVRLAQGAPMEEAAATPGKPKSSQGRGPSETSLEAEGSFVRTRPQRCPFQEAKGFSRRERRVGEEIVAATSPAKVLEVATRQELSPVNCITAIHRIASLSVSTPLETGSWLLLAAAEAATQADARGPANFVRTAGSMRVRCPMQGLMDAFHRRLPELGSQGTVNTLRSLAALQA
ncbi:unnamed protein product [Symbiodinium natans]|uniref:Uncharacterized protein n=1 Tax=Symbiodinium natans TaxID=878477 RepID=A0A812S408_9DINO|nr:unnamed protein product [Symbiodinium natans]